jgi:hypothetical protein
MSGMGDDMGGETVDDKEAVYARRHDVIAAAMIRAGLVAARGLAPSQACRCGPDGCADSSCPGRPTDPCDSEGGEI